MVRPAVGSTLSLGAYAATSIATVFMHRKVLRSGLGHPLVVAWVQQLITVGIFEVLFLLQYLPGWFNPHFRMQRIPFRVRTLGRLLPLSCSYTVMVVANNYCLLHVPVASYQVARALTLLFNVILSRLLLGMGVRHQVVLACCITSLGFCIGGLDTRTLSPAGCLAGAVGSFSQAVYTVSVARFLGVVPDQTRLLYYNAVLSLVLLLLAFAATGDIGAVFDFGTTLVTNPKHTLLIAVGGLFGVLVNFASYWCLRYTSPLSFNITGYAKSGLQSLGGILIAHEPYSASSLTGIALTLSGSFYYSLLQRQSPSSDPKEKTTQRDVPTRRPSGTTAR